ncbi:hypothetical protein [Priestia megaterium]|uniref:hypothetical protein n=1 Tax=Priestia megaterium TaxID=1404 RepID=UPI002FFF1A78
MYNEKVTFTPNHIYVDLKFNDVKEYLKTNFNGEIKDLGSILLFKNPQRLISVNDIGQVNILYNHLQDKEIDNIAERVEMTFQQYVKGFHIERENAAVY